MRVAFVGSVGSSYVTLQKLISYKFEICGVWGLEQSNSEKVSCYRSLEPLAKSNNLQYWGFKRINDETVKKQIKESNPDIIFVIGLSQLIDKDLIDFPKYGSVGFHPTKLPDGRGRAPVAWLIQECKNGAATFFKIDDGVDSGMIYAQEEFQLVENDDVESVSIKVIDSINKALDRWLPELLIGKVEGFEQNEKNATYTAKRAPEDGLIYWQEDGILINRLIKSVTRPYPGAFTYLNDKKLFIWKCKFHHDGYPKGVVGRVVELNSIKKNPIIQTGKGFIEIEEYELVDFEGEQVHYTLKIGQRLGYYEQTEIFNLRKEIKKLKERLNEKYTDSSSTS